MGCDGGVVIYELDDIRKNWNTIKLNLIELIKDNYQYVYPENDRRNPLKDDKGQLVKDYTKTKLKTEEIKSFDIDSKSNEEVFDLIDSLLVPNLDIRPYYFKDSIIMGYGDNVYEEIKKLSRCLDCDDPIYIETWT